MERYTAEWYEEQRRAGAQLGGIVNDIYFPTYALREDLDHDTARWLGEQQGDGPLDLASVTDVCATYRVRATLRDEQGTIRGHVDADGNYRLT